MKNMFKIIGITVCILVIGVSFTACEEDEFDPQLVAKWYSSEALALADLSGTASFEFKEDGKYSGLLGAALGSYTVKSGTISTKNVLGISSGSMDYVITGNTLTITNSSALTLIINGTYYKPSK